MTVLFGIWLWTGIAYLIELWKLQRSLFIGKKLESLLTYKPFSATTSLIIPFKGIDTDLEKNIRSFMSQHATEIIFVADSRADPAYPILKRFKRAKVLIAKQNLGSSGKCCALITGARAAKGEILVFADSDCLARKEWLSSLVAPLADETVGATTGYRWYISDGSFASLLKSAWDETGTSLMLSRYTFVWGGSYAFRKKDFLRWKLTQKWSTTVADDIAVTRAVHDDGKKIVFCPSAVVTSEGSTSIAALIEFTNRQIFLIRNYLRRGWKAGVVAYGFYPLLLLSALFSLLLGYTLPGTLLVLCFFLPIFRSYFMRRGFEKILENTEKKPALLAPLAKLLMFYNLVRAKTLRSIVWRGREYFRKE